MIELSARQAAASIAATLGLVLAVQAQAQDTAVSDGQDLTASGFDALVAPFPDFASASDFSYGDPYLDTKFPAGLEETTAFSLPGFGKGQGSALPISVTPPAPTNAQDSLTANGVQPYSPADDNMTLAAANDPIVRGPDGRLYRLPLNAPVQPNAGGYASTPAQQPGSGYFGPSAPAPSYQDARIPASIGAHVGTLGVGINGTFFLSDAYSVTAIYEYGKLGFNRDTSKIDNLNYDIDGDSGSVYMNFHPMRSNLHLSAGLQKGAPGVYASGSKTFGATTVDFMGSLKSSWNYGPYLGIGVGSRKRSTSGFSYYGDLGVSYMGQSDTTYSQSAACSSLAASDQSSCLSSAKAFRDLVDGIDGEYIYPVLRFGASYRF